MIFEKKIVITIIGFFQFEEKTLNYPQQKIQLDNGIEKYLNFWNLANQLEFKHKIMKSFISSLALFASVAYASEGNPAAAKAYTGVAGYGGNYGGYGGYGV